MTIGRRGRAQQRMAKNLERITRCMGRLKDGSATGLDERVALASGTALAEDLTRLIEGTSPNLTLIDPGEPDRDRDETDAAVARQEPVPMLELPVAGIVG